VVVLERLRQLVPNDADRDGKDREGPRLTAKHARSVYRKNIAALGDGIRMGDLNDLNWGFCLPPPSPVGPLRWPPPVGLLRWPSLPMPPDAATLIAASIASATPHVAPDQVIADDGDDDDEDDDDDDASVIHYDFGMFVLATPLAADRATNGQVTASSWAILVSEPTDAADRILKLIESSEHDTTPALAMLERISAAEFDD
jgi:hypothetical protein